MVKNYILWVVFFVLLTVISATACIAGQQDAETSKKHTTAICVKAPEDTQIKQTEDIKELPATKKDDNAKEVKEANPSILNSNFIFYIIYKFKFMDASSHIEKDEDVDTSPIPVVAFAHKIFSSVYSFFLKLF